MTYGEVAADLRTSMTWLMSRRRTLHLIGSTPAEQAASTTAIMRYRTAVLDYCHQAITLATPSVDLTGSTRHTRTPVEELRHHLAAVVGRVPRGPALTDLLVVPAGVEYVARWQQAARAAVVGERELSVVASWAHAPAEQNAAVVKDAADLVRAVVVLEGRMTNFPGWTSLGRDVLLARAADAVSAGLRRDPRIDAVGWQPRPGRIHGPLLPGLGGAVQTQHNLVVELDRFPSFQNLRRILIFQHGLSVETARLASPVEVQWATVFRERADTYADLVREARQVNGLIGDGGRAAVDSITGHGHLLRTRAIGGELGEVLAELHRVSLRVDLRIARAIEHGLERGLYLVAVDTDRFSRSPDGGVYHLERQWVPAVPGTATPMAGAVKRLSPPAIGTTASTSERIAQPVVSAGSVRRGPRPRR